MLKPLYEWSSGPCNALVLYDLRQRHSASVCGLTA